MSLFIRIINKIVPPIFFPSIFKECLNYFFRGENKIFYEDNFYNRIAFVNKSVSKFKNCNYLEIGVADNFTFNSVPLPLENKVGVDPSAGGTHRMTSDEFFLQNEKKFDVIFIDGLHTYEQCQKDCLNSLKFVNDNGIIIFHDFLPKNYLEEKVPRKQASWTGDIWKVAVELSNSENMNFKIINIDYGIGILKPGKNAKYQKMPELKNMRFDDFLNKFYNKLPLINSEEAIKFIQE